MVRHICMFKMKEENKEANIARAIELANELLKPIEYIRRFEVVVNSEKDKATNDELSLIFDYASSEDLEKYRVHPNHVKFGDYIKSVREARACIDYEFDENETMQVIFNRKSTKNFKADPVPDYIIDKIVEAGIWAPSGMNRQAGVIVAITNKALIERLSKMNAAIMGAKMDPFYGAPCVLLVLAKKEVGTYVYDGSLVMGNMMIAAEALGVGSCWIHRAKEEFESEEGKQILKEIGIEGDYEGIGHCVVGFPATLPASKARVEGRVFKVK